VKRKLKFVRTTGGRSVRFIVNAVGLRAFATIGALAVGGCSAASTIVAMPPAETPAKQVSSAWTNLYVANEIGNSVTIYAPGATMPSRTITQGIAKPKAIALDRSGNLYVANGASNTVTVYASGGSTLLRTISSGVKHPSALAIDASSNLYVANAVSRHGSVTVYAPGGTTPVRTITTEIDQPEALLIDRTGSLYVANFAAVTVYAPHTQSFVRTISKGIDVPQGLSMDESGDLYVANSGDDKVTIYPKNGAVPERTLVQPKTRLSSTGSGSVASTTAVAVDASGNVYVATWAWNVCDCIGQLIDIGGVVNVYAPGATKPSRRFYAAAPQALASDAGGTIYVANLAAVTGEITSVGPGFVSAFTGTATKPTLTITAGVNAPTALAFGP
jgi:sugar lactone lactonase YvrE